MNGHIYLIASKRIDGGIYVGSSIEPEVRWQTHRRTLRQGKHHNQFLQRTFKKYGEDDLEYLIAEDCPQEKMVEREQEWITALRNGAIRVMNLAPAGRPPNTKGYRYSEEARRRVSDGQRGRKHSLETRQKMSKAKMGNQHTKGRKASPETIAKMRANCHPPSRLGKKKVTNVV